MINILIYSTILIVLLILVGFIHFKYWKSCLTKKLFSESALIKLYCGEVEYATLGEGPILFISHGGGTGHDNIYTYDYLVKEGFKLLCPSKPGYLRTKVEVADTFEKQADMFAELLDKLGIQEKVGVLSLSMGGPAALQFVLRHPDRIQCLVMQDAVSKEYHPSKEAESSLLGKMFLSPVGRELMGYIMDGCTQLWPKSIFTTYLQVESKYDKRQVAKISRELMKDESNVRKIKQFSRQISPMSLRCTGTNLELALAAKIPRYPLEQITVPTLITHSRMDNDVSFDHGEFVAQSVKGAEFYPLDGCGHLFWFGPEGEKVQTRLIDFLKRHLH
ncbi:MAG: alpha/beta hydrolase [Chthoniobacterales bacterium]